MRVKALQQVFYDGRDREIGEEFETLDDMHAKVLMIAGRVETVTMQPQPEKQEKRRRYKTRDMRAEK